MTESIPKKSATIAIVRKERLLSRLQGERLTHLIMHAWWNSRYMELILLFAVALVNFYIVYPFIRLRPEEISYSGPLIPLLAKPFSWLFGLPDASAVHVVIVLFFLAMPHGYYQFIKIITDRKWIALLSSLIMMIPFFPFAKVRVDLGLLAKEGPAIASLTLIPVALAASIRFIRSGEPNRLLLASIGGACLALTSLFGFMLFGVFASITAFSEILLGHGRLKMARLAAIFFFAVTLSAFWYNPAFVLWLVGSSIGQELYDVSTKLIPILLFAVPVLAAFGYLLFDRKPHLQPVFLAFGYTLVFGLVLASGGTLAPSHPSRYMAALGLSLSFLLSILLININNYLIHHNKLKFLISVHPSIMSNMLPFVASVILVLSILFGRNALVDERRIDDSGWFAVSPVSIWTSHDQFKGIMPAIGTGISVISLGLLIYLTVRTHKHYDQK